ncbi:MAG: YrhK family protein [Halothece sp.]
MPHLFTSRPRQYTLFSDKTLGISQYYWEIINSILYIIGGVTFIIGSIFFLPQYEELFDLGAWIFFFGSLIYLVVTAQDWWESTTYLRSRSFLTRWDWLEFVAANSYLIGTILFIIGSLLFLSDIDKIIIGSWCFIIGSFLFLLGACINIFEIIHEASIVKLQLLNITAITYAIGSVLFLVASIPYLWKPFDIHQPWPWLVFTYVAWEYIIGSLLFLAGGITNYFRLHRSRNSQQLKMDV